MRALPLDEYAHPVPVHLDILSERRFDELFVLRTNDQVHEARHEKHRRHKREEHNDEHGFYDKYALIFHLFSFLFDRADIKNRGEAASDSCVPRVPRSEDTKLAHAEPEGPVPP